MDQIELTEGCRDQPTFRRGTQQGQIDREPTINLQSSLLSIDTYSCCRGITREANYVRNIDKQAKQLAILYEPRGCSEAD